MFNFVKNLIKVNKKEQWFIFSCEDKAAPIVRYKYVGSSLIIKKEDAMARAIYVLNEGVSDWKNDSTK